MSQSGEPGARADRGNPPGHWWQACIGVLAAVSGLATASLVAGLLGGRMTPVVAVSEAAVDRVPRWLKDLAINAFGAADKAVLVGGVLATVLVLSAVSGLLAARALWAGVVLAAALAVLAVAAVLSRPGVAATDLLPTLAGAIVALVALERLTTLAGALADTAAGPEAGPAAPSTSGTTAAARRSLLRAALFVGVSAAILGSGGQLLGGRRRAVEASRADVDLPRVAVDEPVNASVDAAGMPPWRTPNEDFYRVDTAITVPLLAASDWRLRIHGLVRHELELDYQALLARGTVQRWITLACVSNAVGGELVGNALWTGVPLGPLLEQAGPLPEADMVLSTSVDGFTASTPLNALIDGRDALVAVGMNGQPLPIEHGFPARLVVPGLYGYVSATKWVVDVEITRFDRIEAYWTRRGWAPRAEIRTASRIDVPKSGQRVRAGLVIVAGTAWAQHRGIAHVQVQVDDGAWEPARLGSTPSADTWIQWLWPWRASRGEHRLTVRAVDGSGTVQTARVAHPFPRGATGHHSIDVVVD